jgi:hypothetical protein
MHYLATAYFDIFNFIYPFIDRQIFTLNTLIRVYTKGFNYNTDFIIALLVFALGELAIKGSYTDLIRIYYGRLSGIKGGTLLRPPGLTLFNKARKCIGFVLIGRNLENV